MGFIDRIRELFTGKRTIVRHKDTGNFLQRYCKSFFHAVDGMIYTVACEHNMLIIVLAILVTTIAGLFFQISQPEWLFCISIMGMISAAEFINTAIEAVVDLASPDFNKLAKIAKDTASSATLVLSITAFIGGLVIFVPKIMELI